MDKFVLAQICGVLGATAMLISSWQKTRKKILFFLIFDNAFYIAQYILLNAYTGAFTNVIGLFRILLFNFKGKNKFFKKNWCLYIIILLYIIVGILTYKDLGSIFPIIASILYAIVLWQENPKSIRIGTSIMLFMWVIYNLFVNAYIGVITEGIMFLSSILAIVKIDVLKNKSYGIFSRIKLSHYRRKMKKLLKIDFDDDYDVLVDIFESEDKALSVLSRFDEYDKDKQIMIKILLNINKMLKLNLEGEHYE